MAKVVAIHTVVRNLDDGSTVQELPPGTVFESEDPELENLRRSGAVRDAGDDEALSDLGGLTRSPGGTADTATTTIDPGAGPEIEPAAEDDGKN